MKYMAIGDSISAGFVSDNAFDMPGKSKILNGKLNITGMSFPAFLAWFLEDINEGSIEEFNNYAMTGTRVDHWMDILNGINNEETNRMLGENSTEVIKEIKEKIKDVDNLTITLGGNEFIKTFFEVSSNYDMNKVISDKFVINKKGYEEFKLIVRKKYTKKYLSILNKLIAKIKSINPNVKIYLIGYTVPQKTGKVKTGIEEIIQIEKILSLFINEVNSLVENVAKANSVTYVDIQGNKKWQKNKYWTHTKTSLSHPNLFGYKTIAQIILEQFSKDVKNKKVFDNKIKSYEKNNKLDLFLRTGLELSYEKDVIKENISVRLVSLSNTYTKLAIIFVKILLNFKFVNNILPKKEISDLLFSNNNKFFLLIFAHLIEQGGLEKLFDSFLEKAKDHSKSSENVIDISDQDEFIAIELINNLFKLDIFNTVEIREKVIKISEMTLVNVLENKNRWIFENARFINVGENDKWKEILERNDILDVFLTLIKNDGGDQVLRYIILEWMNNIEKYNNYSKFEVIFIKIISNLNTNKEFIKLINRLQIKLLNDADLKAILIKEVVKMAGAESSESKAFFEYIIKLVLKSVQNEEIAKTLIEEIKNVDNEIFLIKDIINYSPKIIPHLFYFKNSTNKYILKVNMIMKFIKIIEEVNKKDISELKDFYGMIEANISKKITSSEIIWNFCNEFFGLESKARFSKAKILIHINKIRKVISEHFTVLQRSILESEDNTGAEILNMGYLFTIVLFKMLYGKQILFKNIKQMNKILVIVKIFYSNSVPENISEEEEKKLKKLLIFNDDRINDKLFNYDGSKAELEKIFKIIKNK